MVIVEPSKLEVAVRIDACHACHVCHKRHGFVTARATSPRKAVQCNVFPAPPAYSLITRQTTHQSNDISQTKRRCYLIDFRETSLTNMAKL